MNILTYLGKRSRSDLIRWGLAFVFLIGLVDYLTGSEFSLFILYLVPVSVVASFAGRGPGFLMALASALIWLIADMFGSKQISHPLVLCWNAVARLALLSVVVTLQSSLAREKEVARTDFLTGIANRKYFFETSGKEIERSRRYSLPFSTAYIDIDNFKIVNDRFGHDAGDRLLCMTADIIKNNVRAIDVAARLGGDEFAVLLPQTGADSASAVLTKLHSLLQSAATKSKWPVTFSFGVVTFIRLPNTVDEMIRAADRVMYEAKSGGKNQIRQKVI